MKTIALCLLALVAALTSGCALAPDRPARAELYDLGPPPAVAALTRTASPATPVLWAGVSAPLALDGTAMIYRLLYAQGGQQPRPYAHARWAESPAQLLGERLRVALAAHWPVIDAGAGLIAAPELRLELDDFSQTFDAPDQSFGVVRLRATRIAPRGTDGADDVDSADSFARRIEQRTFSARVPAPGNDAASGAQALRAATDQVIDQIVAWLAASRDRAPAP